MTADPKIAGMGMLDLVEEVHRVREQRDRYRETLGRMLADNEQLRAKNGCFRSVLEVVRSAAKQADDMVIYGLADAALGGDR